MERELVIEFSRVTEAAAINCKNWVGKMDKMAADGAAVEAMRHMFETVDISGTVVIGEGEMDEAPMLYIGEKVGLGGAEVDIAVDPLEGTNLAAKNQPGAITVMAVADAGGLLHAPDMYMDKIIVGPGAKGAIDIEVSVEENLKNVAKALNKPLEDLTVCLLDRQRHEHIKQAVKALGARVQLITDGDVSPALACCFPESGIDMVLGIGGAPEGVLAAAAVKCMGGDMQGKLAPENDEQVTRAESMGTSCDEVLTLSDLVPADDVMFVASGVTSGNLLKGVEVDGDFIRVNTVVLRHKTGTVRFLDSRYRLPLN
ncbi:class II fructose-bisphosphatase [Peptococcus simiae]|uniref:class II fructose-bisphosphatase n=1 Tax=Peptococcus simiae TaxID=1643805 RepID=UPI00397EE3C6